MFQLSAANDAAIDAPILFPAPVIKTLFFFLLNYYSILF